MRLLEVLLDVSVELPDVDAVTLAHADDLLVVPWVKHDAIDWVSVTNKALEVVRNSFLRLVVPDLYHAVLASCQKIT